MLIEAIALIVAISGSTWSELQVAGGLRLDNWILHRWLRLAHDGIDHQRKLRKTLVQLVTAHNKNWNGACELVTRQLKNVKQIRSAKNFSCNSTSESASLSVPAPRSKEKTLVRVTDCTDSKRNIHYWGSMCWMILDILVINTLSWWSTLNYHQMLALLMMLCSAQSNPFW